MCLKFRRVFIFTVTFFFFWITSKSLLNYYFLRSPSVSPPWWLVGLSNLAVMLKYSALGPSWRFPLYSMMHTISLMSRFHSISAIKVQRARHLWAKPQSKYWRHSRAEDGVHWKRSWGWDGVLVLFAPLLQPSEALERAKLPDHSPKNAWTRCGTQGKRSSGQNVIIKKATQQMALWWQRVRISGFLHSPAHLP